MENVRRKLKVDQYYKKGIDGRQITIAVLDTGVARHYDLNGQVIAFQDFIGKRKNRYDDNGHGTHICGILAGRGALYHRYRGIAPRSQLVVGKVLDDMGNGKIEDVIRGIHWIIDQKEQYNIRLLNISIGNSGNPREKNEERLIQAVEDAWNQGIIVVVAAGNKGPRPGTITIPGVSKKVITVGALDTRNSTKGEEQQLLSYSGCGPTWECIVKPEIVTFGDKIISCGNYRNGYVAKSGTSMSTPIVTGCLALLLQKHPNLTNKEVKEILKKTSVKLEGDKLRQGWGALSLENIMNV